MLYIVSVSGIFSMSVTGNLGNLVEFEIAHGNTGNLLEFS